jgi:multidrug efflux pump subunit AcrA (membrane-fusion protein)
MNEFREEIRHDARKSALGKSTLVMAIGLVACGGTLSSRHGFRPGEGRVEAKAVEDVFLLTGEIRALRSAGISVPQTESWQVQIKWIAEDGAEVREGDPVVEFDNARVLATLEERRTRLRQAEIEREGRERAQDAELEKKRVAVEKAEVEVRKAGVDAAVPENLRSALEYRKLQGALLEKQSGLEKARADLEAARISSRSELEVARIAEQKARREMEASAKGLASVSVRAPRNGIFIVAPHWRGDEGRKLQSGDNLFTGLPVASIPDLAEMEVDARLSEVDHGAISSGMKARIALDTYPDRSFPGRVEEVSAVATEARDRPGFPVRVSLERTDPALMRPGMSVRVEVVRGEWPRALTLPRAAVRFEGTTALVTRPGRSDAVPVRLAACTPVTCIVESGLSEGDRVRLF